MSNPRIAMTWIANELRSHNIGLETKSVVVEQKVFHTAEHPSHVVLPVVPARREGAN